MSKKKKTIDDLLEEALVPDDEQPFEIPKGWEWSSLGVLLDKIQYGYTEKATFENIGPHFLRITDLEKKINWINVPYCAISDGNFEKYKLNHNDLVVARMGSVGKSAILKNPENSVFASYLIRLVPNKDVSANYLSLFMQSNLYWNQIQDNSKGTTRANVNTEGIKKLKLPIAPFNEQERIVDKIEILFAKIDKVKQFIEEAKENFEQRRAAILNKFFSENIAESRWISINDVCELISDCPHSTPKYIDDGEYPAIRSSDIKDGRVIAETANKVSKEDYISRISRTVPRKGDIIYCREGSGEIGRAIGKAGILLNDNVCLAQRVVLLRPNSQKIISEYFVYALSSPVMLDQVSKNVMSTTSPRINIATLKQLKIPIAPLEIQIDLLNQIEKLISIERKAYENIKFLEESIKSIEQSILSKAFKGELGANDPTDEPAIELLKSILQEKL